MHKFTKSISRMSGQNFCQKIPKPIRSPPPNPQCNCDNYKKSSENQDRKIFIFPQWVQPHSLVEQAIKYVAGCACFETDVSWNHRLQQFQIIIVVVDFFKCDWACLLQRSLGNICVHGRHGYCLIVIIPRPEITKVKKELQIPLKIFVQESIKYGVDTSGYHCSEVAEQEEEIMVAHSNNLMVPIKHNVKDGKRQPADCKCYHNGQQHDVDSFGFTGPALVVSHLVHHVVPSF